jgi:hypothetical protein
VIQESYDVLEQSGYPIDPLRGGSIRERRSVVRALTRGGNGKGHFEDEGSVFYAVAMWRLLMSERCMYRIGIYECEGEYTKKAPTDRD